MGQFSWIYSDTDEQLIDGKIADTYLLIPEPFQKKYGKSIYEKCYNGYGMFGEYDVYDLVAEWNKEIIPKIINKINKNEWHCKTNEEDIENLNNYYYSKPITCELRWLGIIMACYDKDNFSLKYPIKITTKKFEYENVNASKTDPNQGWEI